MVREEGAEHENSPEAENDARDRRQRLDERAEHTAHAARSELTQVERDRDRERRRDQQRDQRGDRRPVDERKRAELLVDGIPRRPGDEAEPEVGDRRAGQVEDLVDDRRERGDGRERGDQRERT